jgi:hypothetical protein
MEVREQNALDLARRESHARKRAREIYGGSACGWPRRRLGEPAHWFERDFDGEQALKKSEAAPPHERSDTAQGSLRS